MPSQLQRMRAQLNDIRLKGLDPSGYRQAADAVMRPELAYDIAAWATVDPATMLDTSCLLFPPLGHNPERERNVFHYEWDSDDEYLLHRHLARGELAGSVFLATAGHPERCRRMRELLGPIGVKDELRFELVADGDCWGHVAAHRMRDSPYGPADVELARALAPVLGAGLRLSLLNAASRTSAEADAPGWLLLDGQDEMVGSTPAGQRWLAELAPAGRLPTMLRSLATAVRRRTEDLSVEAPVAAGGWVVLHGSRADGFGEDEVAVVIEPKRRPSMTPELAGAYGLTTREQEVMTGVLRGRSTKELGIELGISPFTAQDHLKSVFAKFGVHSRAQLAAKIFEDHVLPLAESGAQPGGYGWFLDQSTVVD